MTPERFREIEAIAAELLDLSDEEREQRLAALPDASLREDVRTLLEADVEAEASGIISSLTDYVRRSSSPRNVSVWNITGTIGRGGTSVVYRGKRNVGDSRSEEVAIKVLRNSENSLAFRIRFRKEQQLLASLHHRNIARMLDAGESSSGPYIVMECVQGGDILSYCKSRRLSIRERLRLFLPICEALQFAHSLGIIHRDLKPGNVLVTDDGIPKLLDFGIAKLVEQDAIQTSTGLRALTPMYASPEQIQGLPCAVASDVYSLALLLYELLTGVRAHEIMSGNPAEYVRVICEQEVRPASSVVSGFDRNLDMILQKALRKEPERRYASVELFASDISSWLDHKRVKARSDSFGYRFRKLVQRHASKGIASLGILALAAVFAIHYYNREAAAMQPKVFPLTSLAGAEVSPSFSPDGKQIAFSWDGDGGPFNVYTKRIGLGSPTRVTQRAGQNVNPAWSPDGRQIAYLCTAQNRIDLIVAAIGGSERRLSSLHPPEINALTESGRVRFYGPAWSRDGKSLAIVDSCPSPETECIYLVSASTGQRGLLTSPRRQMLGDRMPALSPDGKFVAFSRSTTMAVSDIFVQRMSGGNPIQLTFDRCGVGGITWSPDSREVIFSSARSGTYRLWRVSISGGTPRPIDVGSRNVLQPVISADGHYLAYVEDFDNWNVWQMPLRERGYSSKLTFSKRRSDSPRYSPDGRRIAFASDRSGAWEIWIANSDGTDPKQITNFGKGLSGSPHWSPDGREILFDSRQEDYSAIFKISINGGTPEKLTDKTSNNMLPSWSINRPWIYFNSDRTGTHQIWKKSLATGELVMLTRNGAYEPYESSDGKYVYFWKYEGGGVWRIKSEGGVEEFVPALSSYLHTRYFDVARHGIYFVANRREPSLIQFFSFQTGRISVAGEIAQHLVTGTPGLTVSPDERRIAFAQVDHYSTDILMVENFR